MMLPQENIKKIGIFRALQLGDMLNVIPAIRALHIAYPQAEIVLIGLPWAASFVKRFSDYFDRFIHFPGYPGLPEQPFNKKNYEQFVEEIRKERFDLILQMQGNGTIVNEMILGWNAKHLAGFHNRDSYVNSPLFMEYPNSGSEIHRHLLLMKHLGFSSQGDYLEFPITEEDINELEKLELPEKKQYVCVHPGSRGAWRQWPPEYFAQLADYCAQNGFAVVVTGTANEEEITQAVIKNMSFDAFDMTSKTSLGAMALLIKNAFYLIANCTGVSHIASATKTPSIIISMDGEPERWAPLDESIHFVTDWTKHPDFQLPYKQLTSFVDMHISEQKENIK